MNFRALGECSEATVPFDAAVLRHAQEDDAVDRALHGEIKFLDRQSGVAECDIASQRLAPAFDLLEEFNTDCGSAALESSVPHVAIEGALEHRFF